MKKILSWSFLFIAALNVVVYAKAPQTKLLNRELFFGNPQISAGQISPDGQWISFMKEYEGIMNIWVKKFDEPFEKARPLTNSKRPPYGYAWTDDSKYILFVKDNDGDENMNIFAVSPTAPAQTGSIPEARNLTQFDGVTAQIYKVSENNPDILYIGLNNRDKAWHDLYELSISTGGLRLLYENKDRITSYNFDWNDQLRVIYRTDEKGNTTFLRVDKDGQLTPIYEVSVTEQAVIGGWNKDNTKFYLITNKGDLKRSTLYLMDPNTLETTFVESDPEGKVDLDDISIHKKTRELISTSYTNEKTKIYWKDKEWEAIYNYLTSKFPGREISFQSRTNDYSKFLISVWGDKYASESYFFDKNTKELIFQYTPRPDLKAVEDQLAEMKPISYKSSDGLEIPAYLTIPVGAKAKNLPVVVLVHGGPKGPRDYWGYDAEVQFLANRGYAVLQPNFRASGGYGKDFLNAGDLQWGKLMQDDITYGVKYLIEQGIADPKRVAIMGGSYGGYATLAGLAFTPDLYAAGVDIVGPSNIFTLLESVPPYWEAARAYLYGMVGDPNTEEGKALIQAASPLFHSDKIVKPLLIIQGANDPRVKKAEADQIAIALRDKGKKVDYLLAADEGHGFYKPLNKMAMYAAVEKFLAETISGKYQPDMPEDVAKKLNELKVDISKVTYQPAEVKTAAALPALNVNLKPEDYEMEVTVEVQGQKIPLKTKRTIQKKESNWVIKDHASSPMGDIIDEITYAADLKPVKRDISQMGQQISMKYAPEQIDVTMMGNNLSIPFKGAYISDGPGFDIVIASLPLKKDYTLSFEMPDMLSAKAKGMVLKVTGEETLNDAPHYVVEVKAAENESDKTTLWVNQATGTISKMVQIVPAMGNAVMTTIRK